MKRICILCTDETLFHPPMFHEILKRHRDLFVHALIFPPIKRSTFLRSVQRSIRFDGWKAIHRMGQHWLKHQWSGIIDSPPHFNSIEKQFNYFNLPYQRFHNPNDPECVSFIQDLEINLLFNNQPWKLKECILNIPTFGCINRHTSDLPKYRGVEPVVHALIAEEQEIGVTIHTMTINYDAGKVLAVMKIPVSSSVFDCYRRSFLVGADLFDIAINNLENGKFLKTIDSENTSYYKEPSTEEIKSFHLKGLRYL